MTALHLPCLKGQITFPAIAYSWDLLDDLTLCRYTSWAAIEEHENSDNYKSFFKTMVDEELLSGPPVITKGDYAFGFRRNLGEARHI